MIIIIFTFIISGSVFAQSFYPDKTLQKKHPEAFAISKDTFHFHQQANKNQDKSQLLKAIKQHSNLTAGISNFNNLSVGDQVEVLRDLFSLQVNIMNIHAPKLVIDETSIKGYAYFEFDITTGGPGTVYLNKKKLKEEKGPSQFINLLLHETRHSYQFQTAQKKSTTAEGRGYLAAFKTQKEFFNTGIKTSFCDFMLLLNEYEAFQFSNFIIGSLTQFPGEISDMGTLASQ